jgi:hypothetical protein
VALILIKSTKRVREGIWGVSIRNGQIIIYIDQESQAREGVGEGGMKKIV